MYQNLATPPYKNEVRTFRRCLKNVVKTICALSADISLTRFLPIRPSFVLSGRFSIRRLLFGSRLREVFFWKACLTEPIANKRHLNRKPVGRKKVKDVWAKSWLGNNLPTKVTLRLRFRRGGAIYPRGSTQNKNVKTMCALSANLEI